MAFSLTFFDVRHGDSIALISPKGKFGLIDSNKIQNRIPALEFIKAKNIRKIEFLCMTHPHADHYNGMLEILDFCSKNDISISNICDPPISPRALRIDFDNNEEYNYFVKLYKTKWDLCGNEKSSLKSCSEGTIIYEEDDFRLTALSPFKITIDEILRKQFKTPKKMLNETFNYFSIAMVIDTPFTKVLLLSDTPISEQKKIQKSNSHLLNTVKVFKISHHGSDKYFHDNIILQFSKKKDSISVISTGCRWPIPSINVIHSLQKKKIPTYCTNYWDLQSPDIDDSANLGISNGFLEGLDAITQPIPRKRSIMPYHGDVTLMFDKGNLNATTSEKRPSL